MRVPLEHGRTDAAPGQCDGRRQAAGAGSDDRDICHLSSSLI
jgi:hypothetical protein